jgi:hypothetical protein
MTVFNPVWRVKIQGVEYTTYSLANLTITSGRTNIYQQAQAGYCNLSLLNLNQAIVNININDSVTIELKDSSDIFIPIFGGTVVDFGIEVNTAGSVAINQILTITALGALSRLPKALTDGVLAQDFDGDQIFQVLQDLLLNNWGEVPAALQWNTYDPTETWANAQNVGLGEIDRPGNYELAARASDRTDIYSLVAALATSGLGYIYESSTGEISYADSTHRSTYLASYGYTDVTANQALYNGLKIQTRAGDVRNDITLKYGTNSNNEVSAEDINSIDLYGRLAQAISTTVKHQADAQDQADFYLTLRATPQANFESITFQLTNPELDDADRDSLINVFMGLPLRISDLPQNMASGTFLGFVEGWSFKAAYNEIAITLNLSPISFSLQAMKWEDVSVLEQWNTISGSLTWETALVVA